MPSLDISSPLTGGNRSAGSGPAPTPAPHTNAPNGPLAAGADGGAKRPGPGGADPAQAQGPESRRTYTVEEPTTAYTMATGRPDERPYGGVFQAPLNPSPGRGNDPRLGPVGPAIQAPGRVSEDVRTDTIEGRGSRESIGPASTTPQEVASQAQGQNLFGSRSGTPRGQIRSVRTQPE